LIIVLVSRMKKSRNSIADPNVTNLSAALKKLPNNSKLLKTRSKTPLPKLRRFKPTSMKSRPKLMTREFQKQSEQGKMIS